MPRLGLGSIDLSATTGGGNSVTTIDDFFFESFSAGQMHPILTTSRKQFARNNNDVVINTGVTKDTSITVPPGQTGTAIRVAETTTTGQHFATIVIDEVTAGDTYTMSLYVKSTYSSVRIYTNTTQINSNIEINLANGTVQLNVGIRAGIEDAGGGWYRVNWTQVAQASGDSSIYLVVKDLSSYTGSTSNFTDYFGMQVEQDGFASSFMLNTTNDVLTVSTTLNDTSEVWDFDGTDIMIAEDPEDEGFWEESYPDGASLPELVLNGDYEELSSELVTNGTFETEVTSAQWLDFGSPTTTERSSTQVYEGTHSYHVVGDSTNDGTQAAAAQFAGDYSDGDVVEITAYVYPITASSNQIKTGVANSNRGVTSAYAGLVLNQWNKVQYQVTITDSSTNNNYISFLIAGSAGEFYLDNVSARIVDPNDRWSLGASWSIEDGKAISTTAQSNLTSTAALVVGNTYEFTLTSAAVSSGSYSFLLRFNSTNTDIGTVNSDGTHTFRAVADSTSFRLQTLSGGGTSFSIDNVSVKEYAIQPLDI